MSIKTKEYRFHYWLVFLNDIKKKKKGEKKFVWFLLQPQFMHDIRYHRVIWDCNMYDIKHFATDFITLMALTESWVFNLIINDFFSFCLFCLLFPKSKEKTRELFVVVCFASQVSVGFCYLWIVGNKMCNKIDFYIHDFHKFHIFITNIIFDWQ